ncbi:MAG: TonB family protein [Terriglobales bacterium]
MAVRAEIFEEHEGWAPSLAVSAVLHIALTLTIIFTGWIEFHHSGENWGGETSGDGGAMSATLVSAVPLPHPQVESQNVLANESKGLSETIPAVKETPPPEAIAIPDKEVKQKPREKAPTPRDIKKTPPQPVEQAKNVVPYGEGGPVSSMYSNSGNSFAMGNTKGGLSVGSGGGDFGSHYSYYVDAVRRKITDNWQRYEIDPHTPPGKRTYITFDINRDGSPSNVRVEQTSGIPSLDISATRALQRIDTFGPLPGGYSGNKVSVEFWFER